MTTFLHSLACLLLTGSSTFCFVQIILMASDDGYPPKYSVISCTISINRNQFGPVFIYPNFQNSYEFNILETQNIGDVFASVSARDADSQVTMLYFLFI